MKIAIIGAGNIGTALAEKLIQSGHTVLIGAKFPLSHKTLKLATLIGEDRLTSVEAAVKQSEVIILAVPLHTIPAVALSLGDVNGKIIIETTNAFGKPLPEYIHATAAIKQITRSVDVVKSFNCIGAEDIAIPEFGSLKADMFVAGDSSSPKIIASQLAKDIGFENCYDLGGDDAIPLLESLAVIWGALAYKTGLGRRIAFKVLTDNH